MLAVLIDIFKKLSGNLESSLLFVDLSDTVFFLSYIALAAFIFVGLLKAKPKFEISERSLPSSGSIGGDSELKRP